MTKNNLPITSITGVGNRLDSVILAEIKNIHNFKSSGQLLAFAGIEPSVFQSGQYNCGGYMVKLSSTFLYRAIGRQASYSILTDL